MHIYSKNPEPHPHTFSDYAEEAVNPFMGINAGVKLPGFIETNEYSIPYFSSHPEEFKSVVAHELGHIGNGDTSFEQILHAQINPIDQRKEVLADRKAAIIHGNPREYAYSSRKFGLETATPGMPTHFSNHEYLSLDGKSHMTRKWAKILEMEGAACKETGRIIDKAKALQIFERSKEFAEVLFKAATHCR